MIRAGLRVDPDPTSIVLEGPASDGIIESAGGAWVIVAGDPASLRERARELQLAIPRGCWLGIGGPIGDRRSRDESLEEAARAIDLGRRVWRAPRLIHIEDVLHVGLLLAHPEAARRIAAVLDPIGEDRKLLAALDALNTCDSVGDAAARLGVHRHTMDNRLRRIASLLGRSPRSGSARGVLELARIARRLRDRGHL